MSSPEFLKKQEEWGRTILLNYEDIFGGCEELDTLGKQIEAFNLRKQVEAFETISEEMVRRLKWPLN